MRNFEAEAPGSVEKLDAETQGKIDKQLAQKVLFNSTEEALASLSQQIETLATKHSLSVLALIEKADSSPEYNQDFLEVLHLKNQIAGLKKSLKK